LRSFSSAFITIQSNSPRTIFVSLAGSICRCAEIAGRVSFDSASRVLGLGGSTSRIIRRISANVVFFSRVRSNGVVPVSNSYSSTPRE
jgi:hypothetical protein